MNLELSGDPIALCDNYASIATQDAFRRLCAEAREGRSPSWKVWIRPAYLDDGKVRPFAIYIGPEGLGNEWRALRALSIDGSLSGNQMFNKVRFALREAPLWATVFGPEHASLLEGI